MCIHIANISFQFYEYSDSIANKLMNKSVTPMLVAVAAVVVVVAIAVAVEVVVVMVA